MVYINEWLPNPVGKDSEGEWVEIYNVSLETVSLNGWRLQTKGDKSVTLGESIGPGEYLVFRRQNTKLTLHNVDGELSLYNPSGELVHRQSFLGSAPEGKSFSRGETGLFSFVEPTLGTKNRSLEQTAFINNVYPIGQPLNSSLGAFEFLGLVLGVAAVLTGLIIFIIKKNENLSNLFFKRDDEVWQ